MAKKKRRKRRFHDDDFKRDVVREYKHCGSFAEVARLFDIHAALVSRWVKDDANSHTFERGKTWDLKRTELSGKSGRLVSGPSCPPSEMPQPVSKWAENPSSVDSSFKLKIAVPEGGLEVKLDGSAGIIGTLRVTLAGLAFVRANGKNPNPRIISWRVLDRLSEIGLVEAAE